MPQRVPSIGERLYSSRTYLNDTSRRPCAILRTRSSAGGCWHRSRLQGRTVSLCLRLTVRTQMNGLTLVSTVFVDEGSRLPRLAMGRWPMRRCRCRCRPRPPPAERRCRRRRRVHPNRQAEYHAVAGTLPTTAGGRWYRRHGGRLSRHLARRRRPSFPVAGGGARRVTAIAGLRWWDGAVTLHRCSPWTARFAGREMQLPHQTRPFRRWRRAP